MDMTTKRVKSDEARRMFRELLDHVERGGTVEILRYNRPVALMTPYTPQEPAMRTITLVSAVAGDLIDGIEISDPECPIEWAVLPKAAQDWAVAQGYGDDADELLYVLAADATAPEGFASLVVTLGGGKRCDACSTTIPSGNRVYEVTTGPRSGMVVCGKCKTENTTDRLAFIGLEP